MLGQSKIVSGALNCQTLPVACFKCCLWHCFASLDFAVLCVALHCFALLCFALLCVALLCIALHCFALLCIALLCIALHCFALLCIALHCFALPCIALVCIALLWGTWRGRPGEPHSAGGPGNRALGMPMKQQAYEARVPQGSLGNRAGESCVTSHRYYW